MLNVINAVKYPYYMKKKPFFGFSVPINVLVKFEIDFIYIIFKLFLAWGY
jgi:hypothetical protein